MSQAIEVARYLLHLAAPVEDEDADCLSNLRLQKLLYYVQGWHLAAYGKPLFTDPIEAWTHGPVVRDIYTQFKQYGGNPIPPSEGTPLVKLADRDKFFVSTIWEQYKMYSPTALRAMIHREKPWKEAFAHHGPDGRCEEEITANALREFFAPQLRERTLRGNSSINVDLWDRTHAAIHEGRVSSVQEARRDLHHRHARSDEA
jgi:uncharacterized phage-associated protein